LLSLGGAIYSQLALLIDTHFLDTSHLRRTSILPLHLNALAKYRFYSTTGYHQHSLKALPFHSSPQRLLYLRLSLHHFYILCNSFLGFSDALSDFRSLQCLSFREARPFKCHADLFSAHFLDPAIPRQSHHCDHRRTQYFTWYAGCTLDYFNKPIACESML
jgi:hypothetical protein